MKICVTPGLARFELLSKVVMYLVRVGQSHPRVIIYINLVELESPMLHAKFQDYRTSVPGEEDF